MNQKQSDTITKEVLDLVKESFKGNSDVNTDTRLRDLFDSLEKLHLVMKIENAYHIAIDDRQIDSMATVNDLVELVKQKCEFV